MRFSVWVYATGFKGAELRETGERSGGQVLQPHRAGAAAPDGHARAGDLRTGQVNSARAQSGDGRGAGSPRRVRPGLPRPRSAPQRPARSVCGPTPAARVRVRGGRARRPRGLAALTAPPSRGRGRPGGEAGSHGREGRTLDPHLVQRVEDGEFDMEATFTLPPNTAGQTRTTAVDRKNFPEPAGCGARAPPAGGGERDVPSF